MSTKKSQIIGIGTGTGGVALDATLTLSGKAADAKATGDAITNLSKLLEDTSINDKIEDLITGKADVDHTHTAVEIGADVIGSAEAALSQAQADIEFAINNHTHNVATTSSDGFMSARDKEKLDGIFDGVITDTGATSVEVVGDGNAVTAASYDESTRKLTLTKDETYNNYILPTAGSSLGGVRTTSDVSSTSGLTACPIIDGVPYYQETDVDYSLENLGVTAKAEEINHISGVTDNVQQQLDSKVPDTRTINNKPLSSDLTLTIEDLGFNTDDVKDAVLNESNEYTNSAISTWVGDKTVSVQIGEAIADLINSAPETLDTLGEIASAMKENDYVVDKLDAAIVSKADASDVNAHIENKDNPHNVTLSQLGVDVKATELNYVSGVNGNIQNQIDNKVPTTRTINGKSLDADIILTANDLDIDIDIDSAGESVLAQANDYTDTKIASLVGDTPVSEQIKDAVEGKANKDHTHDDYASTVEVSGSGNAITSISQSGNIITAKMDKTFLTSETKLSKEEGNSESKSLSYGDTFTAITNTTVDNHKITDTVTTYTLPSETTLEKGVASGSGNAVTDISVSGHTITLKKDVTFSLSNHEHTAADVKADAEGSAAQALADAKTYINAEISKWVGDETVATKISNAIDGIDYPVDSVNGKTGDVILSASDVKADEAGSADKAYNDAKSYTDEKIADLTTHVSNKSNPHNVTLTQLGISATAEELNQINNKVPATRTINGKPLSDDITLTAGDLGVDVGSAAAGVLEDAKEYANSKITEFVGDKTVATQIQETFESIEHPVHSVNGQTGEIVLSAADVGADAAGAARDAIVEATSYTDSEIEEWVGKETVSSQISSAIAAIRHPVDSVNGKTGVVVLSAEDVGALPSDTNIPSIEGLASESYVDKAVANLVNSAPDALNTLNELASALGDDPNFATTIATQIGEIDRKIGDESVSTQINKSIDIINKSLETKANVEHTHNYAGSDNVGGAANSANKLNTNAGSDVNPVYFANGVPVKTAYTLGANVPSDAKFTDTTYNIATTDSDGLMSAEDKAKLDSVSADASKVSIDDALSSTSTNPVQNKIVSAAISDLRQLVGDESVSDRINVAISDKAHVDHTHTASEVGADESGAADRALSSANSHTNTKFAELNTALSNKADSEHTHNYAGSDRAGGSATSANKLNTDAGSSTNPVYFSNGVPVATTYKLESSVPSNAKFTDTTYSVVTENSDGLMSVFDKGKLDKLVGLVGDESVSKRINDAMNTKADSDHTHDNYASNVTVTGSGNAITNITQSGNTISATKGTTFLTSETSLSKGTDNTEAKTLSHGGTFVAITDTSVSGHKLTDTTTTYTLPSETSLSKGITSGSGNAVTDISVSGHIVTLTKGKTFSVDGHTHHASDAGAEPAGAVNAAISKWVGDKTVAVQIDEALKEALEKVDASGSADGALATAKSYTDGKIADLINGAPATLDTLKEIADAMQKNEGVVAALDEAIGKKANATDLSAHISNQSNPHNVTISQLGVTATATELNYVDGVTSNIQTQLNAKVSTSRKINNKSLTSDITLSASDVGAESAGAVNAAIAAWVGDQTVSVQINAVEDQIQDVADGKADKDHTHNYAGSSSVGGAATSANKLNTNAGSATQPVYFTNGVPTPTIYTLGASVPSEAKFTDTVYTHPPYTAITGVPTANQTPGFGGTFSVSQPVSDETGHITAMHSRTITIPNIAATTSAAGLMSAADKTILDNLKTLVGDESVSDRINTVATNKADKIHTHSEYMNQNAFSNVVVGSTAIAADSTTDTLTIVAGSNITLTPDASADKITISATNTTYSAGTGISLSGTTFSNSGVRSVSTGSKDGTINVNRNGESVEVSVKGLKSAAYTESSAYDVAGAADTALASAKSYTNSELSRLIGDEPVSDQMNNLLSGHSHDDYLNIKPIPDGNDKIIPSGDDLNRYKNPGAYRCPNKDAAASLTNAPPYSSAGFRLIVTATSTATDTCMQLAIFNVTTAPRVYWRIYGSSSFDWSPWYRQSSVEYGTEEYVAGTTSLPTGTIYIQYE